MQHLHCHQKVSSSRASTSFRGGKTETSLYRRSDFSQGRRRGLLCCVAESDRAKASKTKSGTFSSSFSSSSSSSSLSSTATSSSSLSSSSSGHRFRRGPLFFPDFCLFLFVCFCLSRFLSLYLCLSLSPLFLSLSLSLHRYIFAR